MSYLQITTDIDDGILILTLHRPDRGNAFTLPMAEEIIDALRAANADDAVKAVVLTGSGRHFCVGADMAAGDATFAHADPAYRDKGGRVTLAVFECLKPVIAAVNGAAVGVGASMILAADVRLASTNAKFGFPFARRGIVLDGAASWFLPRTVGMSTALEWAMSGRVFDVQEAAAAGLVRAPVEPEELLGAALTMARSLVSESAPVSVALIRQMLWRLSAAPSPMQAHVVESRGIQSRGGAADAAEGIEAFLHRRPSDFAMQVSSDLPDYFPWWPEEPFVALGSTTS